MPIELKDLNLSPQDVKYLVTGAQVLLSPSPDEEDDETAVYTAGGKSPIGGHQITRKKALEGLGDQNQWTKESDAVYTEFRAKPKSKEDIQEWARWNSLTSGEEGWTGQNEPMDEGEPKTYIVRHGSTEFNNPDPEKDRIRGHQDVPLSEKGREESEQTASELADSGIKTIITSDLSRAADTADAIAEKTGADVIKDSGLRPWHFGDSIEGKKTADMLPKIKKLVDNPDEVPPGGESFNQFKSRFLETFHKYQDEFNDQDTALVTHYRGVKLLEAWRATGVDNDDISQEVFEEYSNKEKPAYFEVVDKNGKLLTDNQS